MLKAVKGRSDLIIMHRPTMHLMGIIQLLKILQPVCNLLLLERSLRILCPATIYDSAGYLSPSCASWALFVIFMKATCLTALSAASQSPSGLVAFVLT